MSADARARGPVPAIGRGEVDTGARTAFNRGVLNDPAPAATIPAAGDGLVPAGIRP